MPYIEAPVACGLVIINEEQFAYSAVENIKFVIMHMSVNTQTPSHRTFLVACHYVKEDLSSCTEDGLFTIHEHNVLVPGEDGFPVWILGPFSDDEREKCRDYLL